MIYYDGRENALLMLKLIQILGARDVGNIGGFFNVPHDWVCPCCYRDKRQMARLDKNGNLLCSIHEHHDHYCERFDVDVRKMSPGDFNFSRAVQDSLIRFPNTLICNDCNVAEPAAKKIVGAPSFFSFSPFEIAYFIDVSDTGVVVNASRAESAYEAAKPSLRLIYERIQSISKAVETGGGFEPLATSVGLVMSRLQANIVNRKEAAE